MKRHFRGSLYRAGLGRGIMDIFLILPVFLSFTGCGGGSLAPDGINIEKGAMAFQVSYSYELYPLTRYYTIDLYPIPDPSATDPDSTGSTDTPDTAGNAGNPGTSSVLDSPAADPSTTDSIDPLVPTVTVKYPETTASIPEIPTGKVLLVIFGYDENDLKISYFKKIVEVLPGENNTFDIAMTPLPPVSTSFGSVTGIVMDAGNSPIAGAVVNIGKASAVTDNTGIYVLPVVPAGKQTITAVRKGFQNFSDGVQVIGEQQTKKHLVMLVAPASTGTILGKVANTVTGEPLQGALISVSSAGGAAFGPSDASRLTATSQADGKYLLLGVPPGTYSVTVTLPQFRKAGVNISVTEAADTIQNFGLVPESQIDKEWCLGGTAADWPTALHPVKDGYVVVGRSDSPDINGVIRPGTIPDAWVAKLNPDGSIAWHKFYGGNGTDEFRDITVASDGNYILTGFTNSTNLSEPSLGNFDIWVMKVKAFNGAVIWEKRLGGAFADVGNAAEELPVDRSILVTGSTRSLLFLSPGPTLSPSKGGTDAYVARISEDGSNVFWQKHVGGDAADTLVAMDLSGTDRCAAIGTTTSKNPTGDVPIPSGAQALEDIWVCEITFKGDLTFSKRFGGSMNDRGFGVRTLKDTFLISGETASGDGDMASAGFHGGIDAWAGQFHPLGKTALWSRCLGGSGNDNGGPINVLADGFLMCCTADQANGDISKKRGTAADQDVWVVKIAGGGKILWEKTYGGTDNDIGKAAGLSPDGCFIMLGQTSSKDLDVLSGNHGSSDFWVVKLFGSGI